MRIRHRDAKRDVSRTVKTVCVAAKGELRTATHRTRDEVGVWDSALAIQFDRHAVRDAQVDRRV
jgi:hypothetical protein